MKKRKWGADMRYNEVPNVFVKGIFEYMGREFPNTTSKTMDILTVANYGNKTISPLMTQVLGLTDEEHIPTDEEWSNLSTVLLSMFNDKWIRSEEIYSLEYKPDDAYYYVSSTKIDDDTTQSTVSSRRDNEKEFGFDSESESGENKSLTETKNQSDVSHDGDKITTTSRHGTSASKTKQQILTEELNFRKHNYIKEVIKDVIDELTISIYE